MPPLLIRQALASTLCASFIFASISQAAFSQENTPLLRGSISIDDLSMRVVKKEVELVALNTDFRNHYMKPNKWRNRRHKFYDMAAGGIANAGDIMIMSHFWNYYRNPGAGLKHKGSLESGPIVVMVAYLTLGGLYAVEGVNDLLQDYRAKRQGFDSHSVLKRAEALKKEIDDAIAARKAALNDYAGSERAMLEQENKVLEDCRDLSLLEFSKLYVDARKKRIARDVTTIGTIAVCATGAFPGALGVVRGIEEVNLKMIGGGGIGFLISGATLAGAPILIHGGAQAGGAWTQQKLSKTLGKLQVKVAQTLKDDAAKLSQMKSEIASGSSNGIGRRVDAYGKLSDLISQRQDFLEAEHKRNKKETVLDFLTYAIEGGPQIAWGTMVARAGYRWNRNPARAFKLIAEGATANEVAWGSWLLNTGGRGIRDELYNLKHRFDATDGAFGSSNKTLTDLKSLTSTANLGTVQ